jgi:hypothetical protein
VLLVSLSSWRPDAWPLPNPQSRFGCPIPCAKLPSVLGSLTLCPARLDEVLLNERFIDSTQLPFGSVKFIHEVVPAGSGSVITPTVVAEIRDEMAQVFANTMWRSVCHDLAPSVENLARFPAQDS